MNTCLNAHWQLTTEKVCSMWLFMVLPEGIPLQPPDLHTVPWAWCQPQDSRSAPVLLLQGSFSFLLLQWRAMFRGTTFRNGSLSSTRVWSSVLRPISPPGLVLCLSGGAKSLAFLHDSLESNSASSLCVPVMACLRQLV